ncbi:carboxymethylenebutenolidase [Thermocladium modestius]|uniref:Carboxymethylenebutenolidase n=1 Tax=Thermocladium modestius TaxID=62609 RepID=A0A830GW12_9CREN|nr:dienelactone hydrolase family protein [Thermocladium modestius]GGP20706.1 carboxymethylenebutenolidase [Thermocladium modestius]
MEEREVIFKGPDGAAVNAFVASGGVKAGIVVASEIWGLTDFIRNVDRRLAGLGYTVMAPNLYSRNPNFTVENIMGVMRRFFSLPPEKRGDPGYVAQIAAALSPGERAIYDELMVNRAVTEDRMLGDLAAAYKYLGNQGLHRFGAIGFCMGGGLVFQLSTQLPLDATAVYYGRNPRNLDDVARLRGPVLGIYAGEDSAINQGLPDLVRAMIVHKKDFEMKLYPGTYHAFATEGGQTYDEAAAKDAWERTVRFFSKNLG